MKISTPLAAIAAIALAGSAQATTAKPATAAKPAAAKPVAAPAAKPSMFTRLKSMVSPSKPAASTQTAARRTTVSHPAAQQGRVVAARTATGKTVHYDCGKAGNANKKACG